MHSPPYVHHSGADCVSLGELQLWSKILCSEKSGMHPVGFENRIHPKELKMPSHGVHGQIAVPPKFSPGTFTVPVVVDE